MNGAASNRPHLPPAEPRQTHTVDAGAAELSPLATISIPRNTATDRPRNFPPYPYLHTPCEPAQSAQGPNEPYPGGHGRPWPAQGQPWVSRGPAVGQPWTSPQPPFCSPRPAKVGTWTSGARARRRRSMTPAALRCKNAASSAGVLLVVSAAHLGRPAGLSGRIPTRPAALCLSNTWKPRAKRSRKPCRHRVPGPAGLGSVPRRPESATISSVRQYALRFECTSRAQRHRAWVDRRSTGESGRQEAKGKGKGVDQTPA